MFRVWRAVACATVVALLPAIAFADEGRFFSSVRANMLHRYATVDNAKKSGYTKYAISSKSGVVGYAFLDWQTTTLGRPNQLTYDSSGRLLAVDYCVLVSDSRDRPRRYGISPARWNHIRGHIDWIVQDANGTFSYARYWSDARFSGRQKIQQLSRLPGIAAVLIFPPVWDLTVWINPEAERSLSKNWRDIAP